MSLDCNCDESGQTNLIFLHDAACWRGFVYDGSVWSTSASSCDNRHLALWHACYKVLQTFYRDFRPSTQQGLAELTKILGRVVHTGDCMAQSIPNMFYGVAVWRSCMLLHLGDIALQQEIKDSPSTVKCGVIILLAVVIPEMVPGNWH